MIKTWIKIQSYTTEAGMVLQCNLSLLGVGIYRTSYLLYSGFFLARGKYEQNVYSYRTMIMS